MKRPPLTQALTRPKQEAGAILHVRDVALLLSCSEKSIRARVDRRLLPFRRLGGRVIFQREQLMAFLNGLPGCSEDEARANLSLRSGEEMRR